MERRSEEDESEKERKKLEREKRFGRQALAEVPSAAPARPAAVREAEPELDLPSMRHGPIVGTCQDMCHKEERDRRARDKQLDVFERLDGDPERTSADLCVRKFSRNISESGRAEPEHMRPVPVLRRTMDHLLSLADIAYDERLLEVYRFLWDRTRGIRQDMVVQDIKNAASIQMHEEMIRFHILGAHELCDQKATPDNFDGFNPQQNIEQTAKALTSLFDMYNTHAREGVFFDTEPEFRAYYLLLILETHAEHFKVEQGQTNQFLRGLRPDVLRSPEVHFAIRVRRTREMKNYVRYFRLVHEATYLQACLMHIYFGIVRGEAVEIMKRVHRQSGDAITAEELQSDMGMDEDEVEPFLEYYGLSLVSLPSGQTGLRLSREERLEPQLKPPAARHSGVVAGKRAERVIQDVLHAGTAGATASSHGPRPPLLSLQPPSFTASKPPLSPPRKPRPPIHIPPLFDEALAQNPALGTSPQAASPVRSTPEPLESPGTQATEAEAQNLLEVRRAEERKMAEIEKMREEIARREAADRKAALEAAEKRRAELEDRKRRQEEAEERRREEEERRRKWEAEQARLRAEAERRRVQEEARRKAALEEKKRRQAAALRRLVVFLCKKSVEEREQERLLEEARARAERAAAALATVSVPGAVRPSGEAAGLYGVVGREVEQVTSTAYELERLGGELAAQRETLWAPLEKNLIASVAAGLQIHSPEARCLAFKLLVSTGLQNRTQEGEAGHRFEIDGTREAESSAVQERFVDGSWGYDDNGRWGRVDEGERRGRRSVFERLSGPSTSQIADVSITEGRVERGGRGRPAVETGLWIRAKLMMDGTRTEYGAALSRGEGEGNGEARLAEGVFDVSGGFQGEAQAKRQYVWLAATEVEQLEPRSDQERRPALEKTVSGSSAIVHVLHAAGLREVAMLLRDRERLQRIVDVLPEGAGVPLLVVAGCPRAEWAEAEADEGAGQEEVLDMDDEEQENGTRAMGAERNQVGNFWKANGDMGGATLPAEDESDEMEAGTNGTVTGMELVPVGSVDDDLMGDVVDDVAGVPWGEWNESDEDGAEAAVGEALGLDELGVDDGRLGEWRVVFVGDAGDAAATNSLLLSGLHWLAANSRHQPPLRPLNLPNLTRAFLRPLLNEVDQSSAGPANRIPAFNAALETAEKAVNKALSEAPLNWPPPEVDAYEGPRKWALQGLPRVGWSARPGPSDAAIGRLRAARLPAFGEFQERFEIEDANRARGSVNKLLATVMGGRENDAAVQREGKRLLEKGRMAYGPEGGVWYQPDWGAILEAIFELRLSSLHALPPFTVYVRSSDLPPEEINLNPLEADNELVQYLEPPGPLLPATFERASDEGITAGGPENQKHEQLSPSPGTGWAMEVGEPISSGGGKGDPPEGFGSVVSERAFDRCEFLRQQQQQSDGLSGANGRWRGGVNEPENVLVGGVNGLEDVRDGGVNGPENDQAVDVNLAPHLMVAEPIREGRAFVAQDVPRGPVRGSLMQPRRLQRLFSGVALESGLATAPARGDDDMLMSLSPSRIAYGLAAPQVEGERGDAPSLETRGVLGMAGDTERWVGFGNGTEGGKEDGRETAKTGEASVERVPGSVVGTVASPPIAERHEALSSRDAWQVGAGIWGSGSGTTGATGTPLKRKTAADEARRQRARVEFETSLETLRVYAEVTEREAVEKAAEGLEVLENVRGRNQGLGLGLAARSGLEAGLDPGLSRSGTETRAGDAKEGGDLAGNMEGVTGEGLEHEGVEGLGGSTVNQAGVSEGRGSVLSPEQRFAAAVADLEKVVQSDGPNLDLVLPDAPEPTAVVETAAEMVLQEGEGHTFWPMEGVANETPVSGNARARFEDLARKTLEALGASPSSCANDVSSAEARWSSPPLRAQ
ncbi:hypothetical protein KFL_000240460 [Klebsormidium nitens]|uniref:SAC3/GANP/THP3 conserved domain-containing protein n=1 Tax=Klebsormidium nitens TaxID=105231 RepID=A0A1Y1HKJ3_KLENI|nr:hypothetical protein KFL_000240460 [Klebsormidium nitens]|eukprot:GAQ79114.1 hypothetical protein KFL_000240460 [Klebsormidium nitens]